MKLTIHFDVATIRMSEFEVNTNDISFLALMAESISIAHLIVP